MCNVESLDTFGRFPPSITRGSFFTLSSKPLPPLNVCLFHHRTTNTNQYIMASAAATDSGSGGAGGGAGAAGVETSAAEVHMTSGFW